MKYLLKTGMVIRMDNGDHYYVIARVVYNGQEYADVVKYPKNKEDYYHEERLDRKVVIVSKKDGKIFIDPIEDKEIQERVRKVGNSKLKPVKKVSKS